MWLLHARKLTMKTFGTVNTAHLTKQTLYAECSQQVCWRHAREVDHVATRCDITSRENLARDERRSRQQRAQFDCSCCILLQVLD